MGSNIVIVDSHSKHRRVVYTGRSQIGGPSAHTLQNICNNFQVDKTLSGANEINPPQNKIVLSDTCQMINPSQNKIVLSNTCQKVLSIKEKKLLVDKILADAKAN